MRDTLNFKENTEKIYSTGNVRMERIIKGNLINPGVQHPFYKILCNTKEIDI